MPDFSQIEGDAVDATETLQIMNIDLDDLDDSTNFSKFQEIVDFFKDAPDKRVLLTKLATKNPEDRINHIYNYVGLRKSLAEVEDKYKKLREELYLYER